MKVALCIVACVVGITSALNCLSKGDCQSASCRYTSFSNHCLDNVCVCLSDHTGVSCTDKDTCKSAYGHLSHCAPGEDMKWRCLDNMCHCIKDD